MGIIEWIKTNLILVLGIALAACLIFGSIGTLWYKNAAEKAELRAEKFAAQLQTCSTINAEFKTSVERQNAAVDGMLARMEAATKAQEAAAVQIIAAARMAAKPAEDLGLLIKNFKPKAATADEPCAPITSVLDEFFAKKGGVR